MLGNGVVKDEVRRAEQDETDCGAKARREDARVVAKEVKRVGGDDADYQAWEEGGGEGCSVCGVEGRGGGAGGETRERSVSM